MIAMTLAEVAGIVDGRLVDADPGATVNGAVEFDSRRVLAGGLFLALPGDHLDGHDYTTAALRAGALACVVSRPVAGPRIEVADGITALTALAGAVARRLPARVVAITGSSGKTTTKDLAAQVLGEFGATVAPPGSFNNELGHPYTVLRADYDTAYLVLELSARGPGHIRHLTEIAPPSIGAVLNVGSAHLGEFGSRAAIAAAKGELVEALPATGVAVLNADDAQVDAMRSRTAARVLAFGTGSSAEVRATDVEFDELGRAAFLLHTPAGRAPVRLQVIGAHQVSNALAVAGIAVACGLPLEPTAAAMTAAAPASPWRMQPLTRSDGLLVINDAYNANPESMGAALQTLVRLAASRPAGRSVAVLGSMAELGADSAAEHAAVGRLAAELGIARLVVVGEPAYPLYQAAIATDIAAGDATWVADVDAAAALLREELVASDVVLIKASRAASLERVATAIVDDADGSSTEAGEAGGTAA
jgi:UDP-N-acetylmuramoyl-tripeptide--D-alanyl-D-alanine ligase